MPWTDYDFMYGGCYVLALWLHRRTKLPLYGLINGDGEIDHAFVYDSASDQSYDARGVHNGLDGIRAHTGIYSGIGIGCTISPVTEADVRASASTAVRNAEMRVFPIQIPRSERSRAVAAYVQRTPALAQLIKK